MDFDDMAARLARIEWHVLKCEKGSILLGPSYAKDVLENAQPISVDGHVVMRISWIISIFVGVMRVPTEKN